MRPPLLSIFLCILLVVAPVCPSLAQQNDSLDPNKSLFVTEFSQLTPFRFDRVISALLRDTPDTTPLMLFQQWIDTQNPAPGLGSDGAGPFCNDELTAGLPTRNGIVIVCPSSNGNLATANPFVDYPDQPLIEDPLSLDAFIPVALVNRFDVAAQDGGNCGEYSIIFAKRSGTLDFDNEFLIAFEAILPNPSPQLGLAACLPVAQLWANLSLQSPDDRRAALEQFYFQGIAGFPPVISAANFAPGAGRIRTNEVNEVGIVGTPEDQGWRLYQFQLVRNCPDGGPCAARMIPQPLPGTPSARFLNASDPDPRGAEFRAEFLRQLPGLINPDSSQFSVNYPDKFLMFESNSNAIGPDHQYPEQFEAGLATTEGQQFHDFFQRRLAELQSDLTPEQVVRRMQSQTCSGCHFQTIRSDFGDGVTAPHPFLFTHIGNNITELQNGEDGTQSRFGISGALRDVFLPARLRNLQDFLAHAGPAANH